jgi:hypothetical protein
MFEPPAVAVKFRPVVLVRFSVLRLIVGAELMLWLP